MFGREPSANTGATGILSYGFEPEGGGAWFEPSIDGVSVGGDGLGSGGGRRPSWDVKETASVLPLSSENCFNMTSYGAAIGWKALW